MNNLVQYTILLISIVGTKAAIKEPGWKHCIHPLHALPNQWGQIVSPGFPNGINTQIQCSWVISANPGYRIRLAFHTLNVTGSKKSCYTQFVEILDFKLGQSMGKFCGSSRPGDYVSWGTRVRFDLQGDTSGAKTKGFDLRYKATKDQGGFKATWSFSNTPKTSKKKGVKGRKKVKKGSAPQKPKKASEKNPPPGTESPPPSNQIPKEESPPKAAKKSRAPAASARPARPSSRATPSPNKRIDFVQPQLKPNGPVIYGANSNRRGVDHGHSKVISMTTEEEEPFNIYIIIGIAAGGVVALIIIAILVKVCIIDKNRKRKKRTREQQERERESRNDPEHFHMSPLPGAVPEQYMTEQIMPQLQSYHHMPMMSQTMSHHYPQTMYPPQPVHGEKYRTAPFMMAPPAGSKSSRSRRRSSRSGATRRDEMQRSKSRSSVRTSRSRSSMRHSRSHSAHPPPQMENGWIMIDPRYHKNVKNIPYPPRSVVESSDSSSNSDWETVSSDSYEDSKRSRRSKRHRSLPRMRSHPPPYESATGRPYYGMEKSRDFDEGYDTGRRTTGTKSMGSKREMEKPKKLKKSKKQRSGKYPY